MLLGSEDVASHEEGCSLKKAEAGLGNTSPLAQASQ